MILVDTSVWIDHLRQSDPTLTRLLDQGKVLIHPFVIGEIATGSLNKRAIVLDALVELPHAVVAHDDEVRALIERDALHGRGLGYIDIHLLASARLTAGARLLTRDKRLHTAAASMAIAATT